MLEKTKEELMREHWLKWYKARVRRILHSYKHSRELIRKRTENF